MTTDHLPDKLEPCKHMTNLVSSRSDETLHGPAKWYTDLHMLTCPHCRAAFKGMRQVREQVKEMAEQEQVEERLSEPEWDNVKSGWHQSEKP